MSDVADKELCKQLYELSGWQDTYLDWYIDGDGRWSALPVELQRDGDSDAPAYDVGFLLRQLPEFVTLEHVNGYWYCRIFGRAPNVEANTPENATAKLAIELFKQGILTQPEPGSSRDEGAEAVT